MKNTNLSMSKVVILINFLACSLEILQTVATLICIKNRFVRNGIVDSKSNRYSKYKTIYNVIKKKVVLVLLKN